MDEPQSDEPKEFKYTPEDNLKTEKSEPSPADLLPSLPDKVENPLFKWSSPDSFSAHKSATWYLALLGVTLVVAGGIFALTRDKITTAVIVASGLMIGIYAAKKPRMISYELDRSGFSINGRYYHFGDFRSFAVIHHGDGRSIVLTPLKRFMPYTYIYCEGDTENQISSLLNDGILPSEAPHSDAIERFLRKVGF